MRIILNISLIILYFISASILVLYLYNGSVFLDGPIELFLIPASAVLSSLMDGPCKRSLLYFNKKILFNKEICENFNEILIYGKFYFIYIIIIIIVFIYH